MKSRRALALLIPLLPLAARADGSSDGGTSTGQLLSSLFQGCWACGVFNTISAIGLSYADTVFSQLAGGMTLLIGLFMALWFLLFAAKLFLPFGPPGASHWNMGSSKLLKLIFVLAFLQTSGPFWDYIFIPIMSTGLGMASQMATAADKYEPGKTETVPNGTIDYCSSQVPDPNVPDMGDTAKRGLQALEQMDCPLSRIQSQFGKGIMIGVATMSQMGCSSTSKWWNVLPGFGALYYLVAGLILVGVFLFGFLVFPFLLIDVLARVVLVAATSPLAIASILFKPTQRIAERAIWSLAQAGLTLMFGAAIAGIGKASISYILLQLPQTGEGKLTDWSSLQSAIENSCSAGFQINFFSSSFYMLVGTGLITIFMMRRASSLASELTGVSGGTGVREGFAAIAGAAGSAMGKFTQEVRRSNRDMRNGSKAADVAGNTKKE